MLASLISIFLSIWLHPFHVSVCEIEHNPENRSLQITQRIFIDDLEEGINLKYDSDYDLFDPHDRELINEKIGAYLLENFSIYLNGKKVAMNYLGHEADTEAVWCYIEVDKVKKVETIEVHNTLLMEVFADQANIVHITYSGQVKSIQLAGDKRFEELIF